MPDFIAPVFLKAQQTDGVSAHVLDRHEVESYLLEPKLIEAASQLVGRHVTQAQARNAIVKAGDSLKAKGRRASLETARAVNRHLPTNERWKDPELEEKVYEWFDGLDLSDLQVIQRVSPGKETLAETLRILNAGHGRQLTRGHLVASISNDRVAGDICDLLTGIAATTAPIVASTARRKARPKPAKRRRRV